MDRTEDNAGDAGADGGPAYAYKPSLMGAPLEFRLRTNAFEWRRGSYATSIPYNRVRRIRLGYRPLTMQSHRFLAEVWPVEGPKLQIVSTSWKSMFEHERRDTDYRAFVTELARRIGTAGGKTLFHTGSPVFLYWPGVVIFAGASLALAGLIVRALQAAAWGGAAFVAAFLALFLWQAGNFFHRNRPRTFRPDAVPPAVLPGG